jgi:hypothetical protein
MSWTRWRRSAVAGVLAAVALVGCTSEADAPVEAADSAGASPSDSPTPTTEATTPAPAESTSGTPAAVDETPSPAPSAPAGCDPGVFTPTVRVDVGRSATQLLGFGVRSVAPGGSVRSPGYAVELFEALFSGVVDQDGAELTGRLRAAVVERLGADVVRDGLDELRVPLRLRNTSGQERDYVVFAFATRSEGSWAATHCPEGVEEPEPTGTKGTFATWQRLDHGVVACDTDPATVSRVARDALLNGCG